MASPIRDRFFDWLAGVTARRPVAILIGSLLLALAAVVYTATSLGFQADRNKLMSSELPWNARFQAWSSTFGGMNDLYVIVDTRTRAAEPARERAERLIDTVAERLRGHAWVEGVVTGFDRNAASPRALRLLEMAEFEAQLARIEQSRPILASPTPQALIAYGLAEMNAGGDDADPAAVQAGIAEFTRLIDAFAERLRTPAEKPVDFAAWMEEHEPAWRYLSTANDRFLVARVTPRLDVGSLTPVEPAIDAVRATLDELRGEFPELDFGVTGQEVIEADETAAATRDATKASILATVLIGVVLVVAFHSVRAPLLLIAAMLVGTAWSFGFVTLTVGHLQVISVVFAAMLLGLGGDFGVHVISRYELVRHRHPDWEEDPAGLTATLREVMRGVGPGIVTGAVTTAAAFAMMLFTDFTGVAEMGFIAAGGVILCMAAMFTVFPALLRLFHGHHKHVVPVERRRVHVFHESWVAPLVRRPWVTIAAAAVVAIASLVVVARSTGFDYDLLKLLPRGVESVRWQERVVSEGGQSVWYAASVADSLEEARRRAEAFRKLPSVQDVMGIGLLFPADEAEKLAWMREVRERLGAAVDVEPASTQASQGSLVTQLGALRIGLAARMGSAPAEVRGALGGLLEKLDAFLAAARGLDEGTRNERLAALQRDYSAWRDAVGARVRAALDPVPLTPADLPGVVISPYVAKVGEGERYALEVFMRPGERGGASLEPKALSAFVREVRGVDPEATGVVVQIYESGRLIWRSYLKAGVYGLVVVFVLVWLDFRRVSDALLSLLPVALGFLVTFGVMFLAGVRLNPANIIVLPLMFGIGVDAGVHVLHRWRQDPLGKPPGLTAGTGKGITLTSLTTMIGFGSLLTAHHRGIQSLGFVMSLGIGLTLLACYAVLPAILELRSRNRR